MKDDKPQRHLRPLEGDAEQETQCRYGPIDGCRPNGPLMLIDLKTPEIFDGGCIGGLTSTAIGLLFSIFMRSQIAAMFATAIGTILPAVQFSGLINPVSSLEGPGKLIGAIFPATHFVTICRGVFFKGLGFADLAGQLLALAVTFPILLATCVVLLRKQES